MPGQTVSAAQVDWSDPGGAAGCRVVSALSGASRARTCRDVPDRLDAVRSASARTIKTRELVVAWSVDVGWLYPASVDGDELVDDLACSARECAASRGAVDLAGWVGAGRAVTAKGVLRRADVPAAARVLGVELPDWVRSAADVPALHWPWLAALGAGLLSVDGGRAVAGWQFTGRTMCSTYGRGVSWRL
jgi:hypothetical protein